MKSAPNPAMRKFLIVVASLVCVAYLAYRALYTFNLSSNYAIFASVFLYVGELFGIINLLLYFLQVWEVSEPPAQPVLEGRTVDVLVPTYNEDVSILRATLEACVRMDYPHKTYVLDDTSRPEVEALAKELGVIYFTRANNAAAKAGNLNAALERTNGEFVVILDADHVPEPHFITRTIGYFRDEKVGYVQTPHAFYNFDSFQARLDHKARKYWEEGHLFYYVIQPGRNYWNVPIFAGSAAIFRRKALQSVGNIATETVTEDLHTGLRIHMRGWRSIAITERLVAGQAAPDIATFHSQRLRWGTGNLTIFKHDNPLFVPGLTLAQRLCYVGSMIHWASGLFKLAIYLTPILMLFTGVPPVKEFTWDLAIITITYLVVSIFTMKFVSNGYGSIINSELFSMVNFWTQIKATFRFLFTRAGERGFVVTDKGKQAVLAQQKRSVWPYIRPQTYLIILSVLALFWGWGKLSFSSNAVLTKFPNLGKIVIPVVDFPIGQYIEAGLKKIPPNVPLGFGISDDYFKPVVPTIWVLIHFWLAYKVTQRAFWPADKRLVTRHVINVPVEYEPANGTGGTIRYGVTADLNDTGMALVAYERFAVGDVLRFTIRGAGEVIRCKGEVRSVVELTRGTQSEGFRYGILFTSLTAPQIDALNRICLHFAIPRMYQEFERGRQGAFSSFRLGRQKRLTPRNPYHVPFIVNSGTTEDTAQFTTTEDISRTATAALLDTQIPKGTTVGYLMATPLGELRGAAKVTNVTKETYGGKEYYRTVFEFGEFEGQGRGMLNTLANPAASRSLESALRPDRKPINVRMAGPTLVAILIAIPLIAALLYIFRAVHTDDFKLRQMAEKDKSIPVTTLEENDYNRIFTRTKEDIERGGYPSNDRLVLLMRASDKFLGKSKELDAEIRERKLFLASELGKRDTSNPDLQIPVGYALAEAGQNEEAEKVLTRLLNRTNLTFDQQNQAKIALARVYVKSKNDRSKLEKATELYEELYKINPNMKLPNEETELWREYSGVAIASGKFDQAIKVLDLAPPGPDRNKQLVAAHILRAQELKLNPETKAQAADQYRFAGEVINRWISDAQTANDEKQLREAKAMKADLEMAQDSWSAAQNTLNEIIRSTGGDERTIDPAIRLRLAQTRLGSKIDFAESATAFMDLAKLASNNKTEEGRKQEMEAILGFIDSAVQAPPGQLTEQHRLFTTNLATDLNKAEDKPIKKLFEKPEYVARLAVIWNRFATRDEERDQIAALLEKARNSPNNKETWIKNQLAWVYLSMKGREARAAEIIGETNDYRGKLILVSAAMNRKDWDKALAELSSILNNYPVGKEVPSEKPNEMTKITLEDRRKLELLYARTQGWAGRWDRAQSSFADLEMKYPNDPEIPAAHAEMLQSLAFNTTDKTLRAEAYKRAAEKYHSVLLKGNHSPAPAANIRPEERPINTRENMEQGFINSAAAASEVTPAQRRTAILIGERLMASSNPNVEDLTRTAWVISKRPKGQALEQGDFERAKAFLDKAASLASKPEQRKEIANIRATIGDYEGAIALIRDTAVTIEEKLSLAELYVAASNWNLASQAYAEIARDPAATPAQKSLAEDKEAYILAWKGDHSEAIKKFDALIKAGGPKQLEYEIFKAEVTLWAKDFLGSYKQFEILYRDHPNDRRIMAGFARAAALLPVGDELRRETNVPLPEEGARLIRQLSEKALTEKNDVLLLTRLAEAQAKKVGDDTRAKELANAAYDLIQKGNLGPDEFQNALARKELANVLALKGIEEYRKADKLYQDAGIRKEDRRAYATIAAQAENFEAARSQATRHLMDSIGTPFEKEARRLLAQVLTWKGDYIEALALYEQMTKNETPKKENRDIRVELADVLRFSMNYSEAIVKYALLLNEEFEQKQLWIGFVDSASSALRINNEQADLLIKVHDRYAPEIQDPRRMSRLAWVMIRIGQASKANALLDRAKEANPQQPAVRKELAGVLAAAGRNNDAIEMLLEENTYKTLDIKEILELTNLLSAEDRLDEAEKRLAAVTNDRSDKDVRVRLATLMLWNKKYAEARAAFTKLQREFPDDEMIPLRIAQTYLWARDYPNAITRYTEILKKKPTRIDEPEVWKGFLDSASGVAGESLRDMPRRDLGPVFDKGQIELIRKAFDSVNRVKFATESGNEQLLQEIKKVAPGDDPRSKERVAKVERENAKRITDLAKTTGRMGLLLGLLGDREKASQSFGVALRMAERDREVWLLYAQAMSAVGDDRTAKQIYDWLLAGGAAQGGKETLPSPSRPER